jgi:hypothetical protein
MKCFDIVRLNELADFFCVVQRNLLMPYSAEDGKTEEYYKVRCLLLLPPLLLKIIRWLDLWSIDLWYLGRASLAPSSVIAVVPYRIILYLLVFFFGFHPIQILPHTTHSSHPFLANLPPAPRNLTTPTTHQSHTNWNMYANR